MKFFKIYGLILGLLSLINLGFYVKKSMPYLINKNIAPTWKWSEILVGKWDYEARIVRPNDTEVYQGEIEYKSDSTFLKKLSYNAYYPEYQYYDENSDSGETEKLGMTIKGTLIGSWEKGKGLFWNETISECNMILDFYKQEYQNQYGRVYGEVPDIECWVFGHEDTNTYGQLNESHRKDRIIKFNKDEIIIETYFSDFDHMAFYIFKRKKS